MLQRIVSGIRNVQAFYGRNPLELSSEEYFTRLLPEDGKNLRTFVEDFGRRVDNEYPSAILAIGSSAKRTGKYRDIDMMVVSEKGLETWTNLEQAGIKTTEVLNKMGFAPRPYTSYSGIHSVCFNLRNGTPLEFIFHRSALLPAERKIYEEKHGTLPFSVLRRGDRGGIFPKSKSISGI